jgi:DNA-binding NarL/FixJ family response regulator
MNSPHFPQPIHIGLFSNVPERLEVLTLTIQNSPAAGLADLIPVQGSLSELLQQWCPPFLIFDMKDLPNGLAKLREIHQSAPGMSLLVVRDDDDDGSVVEAVLAGARGYIDLNSDAITVRKALEHVPKGVLWVPPPVRARVVDRLARDSRQRTLRANQAGTGESLSGP